MTWRTDTGAGRFAGKTDHRHRVARQRTQNAVVEGRDDIGDRVVAGSLNKTGSFVMRADKVGADTLLTDNIAAFVRGEPLRNLVAR